jgi:hypothetical protein
MSYPDQIDKFSDKLNKKTDGSIYVIEEVLPITAGKYEGLLAHDNITNTTIRVYTGSKLTGQEVINYIISVPSETPWRRHIKVFADVAKVYVTYETPGDTVEADDVNVLQESMTTTQEEVERYKAVNDEAVEHLDDWLTTVEANKVDKVPGKGLSTEDYNTAEKTKLAGIEIGANKYIHPSTHLPSIIVQDTNNRFATDGEKSNWNAAFSHASKTDNPHQVTVLQIGAETPAGAQAKADGAKNAAISAAAGDATTKSNAVQSNLNTHTANKTDAHDIANRLESVRSTLINYIDQSIAHLINGAPEALDTLYELANALGNDPNFSVTMTSLIGQKLAASEVVTTAAANKVLRLDASSKLPASVIAQDSTYRFVTDTEKVAWGAKSSLALGETLTTAYRGDRGKVAYDHSQTAHAPVMDIAIQAEAEAGTSNAKYMTPLRVKQAIIANPLPSGLTWNQIKGV